jgi:xylulokinase
MKNNLYFCADIGTSSLKAALIDSTGLMHGFARVPYAKTKTADSWLVAFCVAVDQLATAKTCDTELFPVAAIVISGNGPTLVPQASVCLPPLYWYDPSSRLPDCPSLFLPKVKTFMDTCPSDFAKVSLFFSPQEWLMWKLGAKQVTVIPHDGYISYYWDKTQCTAYNISDSLFPPFVTMGEVIGEFNYADNVPFTERAASLLAPRTPIIAGASDFIMSLIGTGTLEPGMVCNRTGSSEGVNLCLSKEDAEQIHAAGIDGLRLLPHAIQGLWNLGAVIPKSGSLFDEYLLKSGQIEKDYNDLAADILTNPTHSGKPILEEMGRNFVNALEELERACQCTQTQNTHSYIKELVLSGGQCACPQWNQYKADISGRTLKVPEIIHAELAGNAVLAAAAIEGGSIREKAAMMIRIKEEYLPR